jgi:hypothetical protein
LSNGSSRQRGEAGRIAVEVRQAAEYAETGDGRTGGVVW